MDKMKILKKTACMLLAASLCVAQCGSVFAEEADDEMALADYEAYFVDEMGYTKVDSPYWGVYGIVDQKVLDDGSVITQFDVPDATSVGSTAFDYVAFLSVSSGSVEYVVSGSKGVTYSASPLSQKAVIMYAYHAFDKPAVSSGYKTYSINAESTQYVDGVYSTPANTMYCKYGYFKSSSSGYYVDFNYSSLTLSSNESEGEGVAYTGSFSFSDDAPVVGFVVSQRFLLSSGVSHSLNFSLGYDVEDSSSSGG